MDSIDSDRNELIGKIEKIEVVNQGLEKYYKNRYMTYGKSFYPLSLTISLTFHFIFKMEPRFSALLIQCVKIQCV